ncbi:hypothetical protein BOTCAL_0261g00180 [Botryotinia calthae]|uniref:2EXR domain-containing protein n=1 Tax=Botryotinia calthae TaxID=38488 RepID=A0A4Y8CWS7_9HELO|nr:hypothetical protein BOTCAL_0261g00180 [Botryotinia calthae]
MDGFNPPSWAPDNQNLTTPGAEAADHEYGRSTAVDDQQQQQQSAMSLDNPNQSGFAMGNMEYAYNHSQTGDTAPDNFQFALSQGLTLPLVNPLQYPDYAPGYDIFETDMQGGFHNDTDGDGSPTPATSTHIHNNIPLNTNPTQLAFPNQGGSSFPLGPGMARSQSATFRQPPPMSTHNGQLHTQAPLGSTNRSGGFNHFSGIAPEHHVARDGQDQTAASYFVQTTVQDNGSALGWSNRTLTSRSLPDNMQYASQSGMGQKSGNMPSSDNPKADRRTNVPSWAVEFEQYMKSDGTYVGQTYTNHKDGSAEAPPDACLLAKEAFQISQAISNSLEHESDEDSDSRSRREAAIWADSFVPPGMASHHGKQKKKFVSDEVYAYHPPGRKNYYHRVEEGNQLFVDHWANNNTRTKRYFDLDTEFPSRLDDIYPVPWSVNWYPDVEIQGNPQKQNESNDLQEGTKSATYVETVNAPRPITRESIMRIVSRISNPIFTGATCGGSSKFSLWDPKSRRFNDRSQVTHLSIKERRNTLRRIKDLLDRTLNLTSIPPELAIVYYMFQECNSSPGSEQSPYLHAKFATFEKFEKLPIELRWMIWEYCCPPKTEHLGLVVGTGKLRHEVHRIELPLTLRICYESRKCKKKYSQPRQLAIGPNDTVAISDATPKDRMEQTLEWYNQIDAKHKKGLKSIRHLEIRDIHTPRGDYLLASRLANSNADRALLIPGVFTNGSLAMFKNLKTLTLTNISYQGAWRGPYAKPYRREEQEALKILISDYLDQARVGDDRLVSKENIVIRDYTEMDGQKVEKDNGRVDLTEEFYSKMSTHLPEEYQN